MFPVSFIKDNFVKQLIISLFNTKLIAFLNMFEMMKDSYNLEVRPTLPLLIRGNLSDINQSKYNIHRQH